MGDTDGGGNCRERKASEVAVGDVVVWEVTRYAYPANP
jgi:hypothetical protein